MCWVKSIANTWTKKFDYIQEVIFYVGDVLVAAKGKHNWEGEPTLSNERHEGSWITYSQKVQQFFSIQDAKHLSIPIAAHFKLSAKLHSSSNF